MPDHKMHMLCDEMLLGQTYPEVHKYLDAYQPLLQSKHREYNHDEETIQRVIEMTGDTIMGWSAYYHIILDEISDEVGQEVALAHLMRKVWNGEIENPFITIII